MVDGGRLTTQMGNSLRDGGRGTAYEMVDGGIASEMVDVEQLTKWWQGYSLRDGGRQTAYKMVDRG